MTLVEAPRAPAVCRPRYYASTVGGLTLTTLGNFGRVPVTHSHDGAPVARVDAALFERERNVRGRPLQRRRGWQWRGWDTLAWFVGAGMPGESHQQAATPPRLVHPRSRWHSCRTDPCRPRRRPSTSARPSSPCRPSTVSAPSHSLRPASRSSSSAGACVARCGWPDSVRDAALGVAARAGRHAIRVCGRRAWPVSCSLNQPLSSISGQSLPG